MSESDAILIPDDEFLARPHLIAWLAYPGTPSKRATAVLSIQDWARWRLGQPIAKRKSRVESDLKQLDKMVDRQLLASERFWRQVLSRLPGDPWQSNKTFTSDFARRLAEYEITEEQAENGIVDRENKTRSRWSWRRPAMGLGYGVIFDWVGRAEMPRPDIETLIFGERHWTSAAIREAGKIRRLASQVDHPSAPSLLNFQVTATF